MQTENLNADLSQTVLPAQEKKINSYFLAGPSKSEKKMKLTVKGGAAVDPDSGEW